MLSKVNEPLLTTSEAASYLGLSLDTVRKYLTRQLIRADAKVGRTNLIAKSELDRYRRERRIPGRPKRK